MLINETAAQECRVLPATQRATSSSIRYSTSLPQFLGSRPQHCGRRALHGRSSVAVRAATDYYDVLGVKREADKKDIKTAYRQAA